jgi:hypothetical protein
VDLLADAVATLPPWLRLILTTRPDSTVMARFALGGVRKQQLDASEARNHLNLEAYVTRRLATFPDSILPTRSRAHAKDVLLDKADGNFLFVRMTLDGLSNPDGQGVSLDEIGRFPPGVGGLYHAMFRKRFGNLRGREEDRRRYIEEIRPVLDVLVAAMDPVPETLLLTAAGVDASALYGTLSQFLHRGDRGISLFHKSLADWLVDGASSAEFVADSWAGHRRLADACWVARDGLMRSNVDRRWLTSAPYVYRRAVAHLIEASRPADAAALITSFDWLRKRLHTIPSPDGIAGIVDDWHSLGRVFQVEAVLEWTRFFREHEHALSRGRLEWTPDRILLQLAMEHGDRSAITIAAEQWLAKGAPDWVWLRRTLRPARAHYSSCLHILEAHTSAVTTAIRVSDDGILSTSYDGTIRIWDIASGRLVHTIEAHSGPVLGGAVLPGDRVLSWSEDGRLQIWDWRSGLLLHTLTGHTWAVNGAVLLP